MKKIFSFDAKTALETARIAVNSISSNWNMQIQAADRDELVSETLARAWTYRNSYNPAKASFRTWIGRIAKNTLLDYKNRRKSMKINYLQVDNILTVKEIQNIATVKTPETIIIEKEGLETVKVAIESLPAFHQEVITLLTDGKPPREIAVILGCSSNAATLRSFRARRALYERIQHKVSIESAA